MADGGRRKGSVTTMETREYTVYKFNELTEDQQQKAVERYGDINVDYEWWDCTYEDAKRIGLEITEFDDYHCIGKLAMMPRDSIRQIWLDHGKNCETYSTACQYWKELKQCDNDDEYDATVEEYCKALCEDYRVMLRNEYEYLTEYEQVAKTLRINEYDFTVDSKIA